MRPLKSVATDFWSKHPYPPSQPTPPPPEQPTRPSALDDLAYLFSSAKSKISSKMVEIDPLIGEYSHLPDMPDPKQASEMIRRIGSCVKPIMRKRGWRVGVLAEFYPPERNLLGLNVNRGQQILVRLRYPTNPALFMPLENVLDTMLHELCHIVRGPHDQQFHALWNELRDEWGTLQIKGYTGEGFLGKGRLVGGNYIPREELRRRARAEAEMERARRKARGESSRRLGGSVMSGGIRDAIATATLRRNNAIVDDNCGTGTKAGDRAAQDALLNGFRSKEEMAEADHLAIQQALFDLMEVEEGRKLEQEAASSQPPTTVAPQPPSEGLTWDAENGLQPVGGYYGPGPSMWSPTQPTSPAPYPQTRVAPELDRHGRPLSRLVSEASNKRAGNNAPTDRSWSRSQATTAASQGSSSQPWDCPWCTLINTANTSNCIACEAARPTPNNPQTAKAPAPSHKKLTKAQAPVTLGWNCLNCGTFMEHQWWTCSMCGLMKRAS